MSLDDALRLSRARIVRRDVAFQDYCLVIDGWRGIGYWPPKGLAHTFRADEVELIEVYPEETEHSGTLCSRLGHSSACGCPPYKFNPPTLVIWLRK